MLFSAKCFIAAMLAYYIALRIGLNRPFWAVVTSYIIAQPAWPARSCPRRCSGS